MSITKELLLTLAMQCSPNIPVDEILLLSEITSNHTQFLVTTIGESADYKNEKEAREKLKNILEEKKAVQIGTLQVNSLLFEKYDIDPMDGFNVCNALKVTENILNECTVEEMEKDNFTDDERLKGELNCFISANDVGNLENNENRQAMQKRLTKSLKNYLKEGGQEKSIEVKKEKDIQQSQQSKKRSAVSDVETPIKNKEVWDVFGDF